MKRTKLIASLMMCVMCLSFLVVGVWATVTSVNFNLNGNLQYYPEGVYVELNGQVYRGDSISTLEPLTSDARFTLEPTTNYDNSTGEPSGNFPMGSWNIQNLTFTPVDRFIQVEVNIKNHSEFTIMATPNVLLNSLDITSNTFTNFTLSDNREDIAFISSGATKTYKLLIQLNDNATETTNNNLSVSFEIYSSTDYITWVEDDPDTTDVVDGYWTLTMGEYEGTPLVWRMVLKEENNDVSSVVGYTQDTPLSGSYYFLLDTYIEDVFECSYENNYINSSTNTTTRTDLYANIVSVADYSISNIRGYLTGVDVYRGYTSLSSEYSESLHSSQTEPENFVEKFGLESSIVYKLIQARTLTDLYSNIVNSTTKTSLEFDTDTGIDPDTTADKLWLISYYEASKITTTQSTGSDNGARSWNSIYWTRTANSTPHPYYIMTNGYIGLGSIYFNWTNCARPAFKISF